MADDDAGTPPGGDRPPDEDEPRERAGTPPGGDRPPDEDEPRERAGRRGEDRPEDDLPATGPHQIFVDATEDEEEADEEEARIPSFEEYRRLREEGLHPREPAGSDDPYLPDADDEETLDSRDLRAGEGPQLDVEEDDDHDGGDTLDGGEQLVGVELPQEEGAYEVPASSSYEDQLARQAADLFPTSYEHTADEIHERRAAAHRRHRRNGRIRLLILVVVIALVVFGVVNALGGGSSKTPPASHGPRTPTSVVTGKGHLAVSTDTAALPGNLLIADWGSRQLLVVSPTGQVVWTYHPSSLYTRPFNPDYAFFDPAGDQIAITEESHARVELLRVTPTKLLFRYGHYDRTGSSDDYLHTPSAALSYADGQTAVADIRNCRIAVVAPPHHLLIKQVGRTGQCTHAPPRTFDSPQSAFPLRGGGTIVTELHDSEVDLISATGKLLTTLKVPRFKLAYSANQTPDGDLIAVDHRHPGAVEIFTTTGRVIWTYDPRHGAGVLFDPSLAEVLPGGDVIVSDDYHDRVIVIDPKTKKIVWQYGHTSVAGGSAGYLDVPVGFDLVHPDSLLDRFSGAAPLR